MGRTINILEKTNEPVTEVMFRSIYGEYSIRKGNRAALNLVNNNIVIAFNDSDLDNMIKLFQAAKEYNI